MLIAVIVIGSLALCFTAWHLIYLLSGRARRDLELGERLRRYAGR
jgi:hypothetical protein